MDSSRERLGDEMRDPEKIVRGVGKLDTPILSGYQIYHNYARPHQALNGRTPAEACGIRIEEWNKWLTLIQSAAPVPTVNIKKNGPRS